MDLYCSLYVDGPLSEADLTRSIRDLTGAGMAGYDLVSGHLVMSVRANPDDDGVTRVPRDLDDFLGSEFLVEVEPAEGADTDDYVVRVAELVSGLRDLGFSAVAACEFEDRLPAP